MRLRAAGLVCRFWHPQTPWQFMEGLAPVCLVVAMRLHGVILAAMADRPLLALSYDPKADAAAPPWPFHRSIWRIPTGLPPYRTHGSRPGDGYSLRPGWPSTASRTAAIISFWIDF